MSRGPKDARRVMHGLPPEPVTGSRVDRYFQPERNIQCCRTVRPGSHGSGIAEALLDFW